MRICAREKKRDIKNGGSGSRVGGARKESPLAAFAFARLPRALRLYQVPVPEQLSKAPSRVVVRPPRCHSA